jgi:hypothetical protein
MRNKTTRKIHTKIQILERNFTMPTNWHKTALGIHFLRRYGQILSAIALVAIFAVSCDGGLRPPEIPPVTSISGTIRYVGGKASWPRRDSVWTVRVVGFRQFPPRDLIGDIFQGRAFFTPAALQLDSTLPLFADSARYSLVFGDSIPTSIQYLSVAMLIDTARLLQTSGWRVIGVYSANGNQREPSTIPITRGKDHQANITVDFKNPPPQPF